MSIIIKIEGVGYTPLKDYNSWRLAVLLPCTNNAIDTLKNLGKHNTTDEVFTLLCGVAYMITGGKGKEPGNLKVNRLKKETLFVVEAGEWHGAVLEESSKILITENVDTSDSNTIEINSQQLEYFKSQIRALA